MKKFISVITVIAILFASLAFTAGAKEETDKYLYVFVHGMMGWGENTATSMNFPYWGMSDETDVLNHLRAEGYDACSPTVGPMSSVWDRSCELFAQLTGTVVDYGEAHSKEYGHERYGRDYTGRAVAGEPWDMERALVLLGHSFGGPTVRVFASLLAYGNEAERAASGENCSELFKGGHEDLVKAVVSFCGVLNGTPLANTMEDNPFTRFAFASFLHFSGITQSKTLDPMLDQWGMSAEPGSGKRVCLNLPKLIKLANSKDHAGYEMTIRGSREMIEKYPDVPSVYYFSYAGVMADKKVDSDSSPFPGIGGLFLNGAAAIIKLNKGRTIDGVKIEDDWCRSDGMVPVASSCYPTGAQHISYTEGTELQPGVWNVMRIYEGATHGLGCAPVAGDIDGFFGMYDSQLQLIEGLD